MWFLGLLHMEIIVERLRREYNIDLLTTPSVEYKVSIDNQEEKLLITLVNFLIQVE